MLGHLTMACTAPPLLRPPPFQPKKCRSVETYGGEFCRFMEEQAWQAPKKDYDTNLVADASPVGRFVVSDSRNADRFM